MSLQCQNLESETLTMPVIFIVEKYAFPLNSNISKILEENEC